MHYNIALQTLAYIQSALCRQLERQLRETGPTDFPQDRLCLFTCVKTVVKNAMRKVSQAAMLFDSPGQPRHPRLYSTKEPIPMKKGAMKTNAEE